MRLKVSAEGLEILREFTKTYPDLIRSVIDASKDEVEEYVLGLVKQGTPVDTGKTKAAWSSVQRKGGVTFKNPEPAARVLEKGLYPGVGPKTINTGDGIFSTQAPEGIIRPIITDSDTVGQIARVFTNSLMQRLKVVL